MLSIESEPEKTRYWGLERSYLVRIPSTGAEVGSIVLDTSWRVLHGNLGESIFVAEGYRSPLTEAHVELEPDMLNVMLVEWEGKVAFRVSMCAVELDQWVMAKPVWKLITLA